MNSNKSVTNYYYYYGVTLQNLSIDVILKLHAKYVFFILQKGINCFRNEISAGHWRGQKRPITAPHDHQSQNSSAQLRPLLMSLLVSVYGEVGTKILNVAMEAATKVYIRYRILCCELHQDFLN